MYKPMRRVKWNENESHSIANCQSMSFFFLGLNPMTSLNILSINYICAAGRKMKGDERKWAVLPTASDTNTTQKKNWLMDGKMTWENGIDELKFFQAIKFNWYQARKLLIHIKIDKAYLSCDPKSNRLKSIPFWSL